MPAGRMLNKKISYDEKLGELSAETVLIFTWIIPHLDVKGRVSGDFAFIKSQVFPFLDSISIKKIKKAIQDLEKADLISVFGDKRKFIQFNGFFKNQKINAEREAESIFPDPDQLKSNSRVTQDIRLSLSKDKDKDKLQDKEQPQDQAQESGSDLMNPNLSDEENLISAITELFAKYTNNSNPDYEAEIKPVLEAVKDKREGLTPEACYKEIYSSFLIMKQKGKTNTDFLMGIIKNKLTAKFSKMQEQISKNNQTESNRIRTQTSIEEYQEQLKTQAENRKKIAELRIFYDNNKKLFTRDEKEQLKKYFEYGYLEKIIELIEPKIEELTI